MSKPTVAVFDLDGVLANDQHRAHLREAKNWKDYYLEAVNDTPINELAWELLRNVLFDKAVILTTRNEDIREITKEWVSKHFVDFDMNDESVLIMRKSKDFRPANVVKTEEMLKLMDEYEITFAIDDDPETCKAYMELGIHTVFVPYRCN